MMMITMMMMMIYIICMLMMMIVNLISKLVMNYFYLNILYKECYGWNKWMFWQMIMSTFSLWE